MYATVYLHYGVTTPFLPVWLNNRGYSADQIGVLLALPMFLKLLVLTPVLTLADRLRRVRDLAWACTATGVLLLLSLNYAPSFLTMLILTATFAAFWDPIPVLVDAYAVTVARDRGFDFGRMRVWGSLSFVAANVMAGWVLQYVGVSWTTWFAAALLALPLASILTLPQDRSFSGARPSQRGEWRGLLRNRQLLLMMASVSLIIASHALVNNFSSIQWLAQGISARAVGSLWATSIAAEAIVLWYGRRWLVDRPPELLVLIGGITAVVRWGLMMTHPSLPALFAIQLLQGLSGMAPILAMMLYIERRVPPHLTASAQGFYGLAWSAALAVATVSCGPLWRTFGTISYGIMALIALLGTLIVILARRSKEPGAPALSN